jgi:hypothetical protein
LRPLQGFKTGGRVDIEGKHWDGNMVDTIVHGYHRKELYVDDPTPHLNSLFYEVMRTGNPNLAIPWDAAAGFANCGRGFWRVVAGAKGSQELSALVQYPGHLVVNGSWTRPPENAREQFLHFIFYTRQVMAYLAKHPVGKKSAPNTSIVAQWISQLPQRTAYVRNGEVIAMIKTLDMPPEVTGVELQNRWRKIQAQTRAKYCHSREQVAQVLVIEPDEKLQPISAPGVGEIAGWGKVGEP